MSNELLKPRFRRQENNVSVSADELILDGPEIADRPGVFRTSICVDTSVVLSVRISYSTDEGSFSFDMTLNEGGALDAGSLYAFDVPVVDSDAVNFLLGSAATVKRIHIMELRAASP